MSVYWGLTIAMPMQCATTLKGATPAPATLATRATDSAVQVNIKNPSVKHLATVGDHDDAGSCKSFLF